MTTAGSAIRVEGLDAHYGPRQVLFGIDLELQPGEILVIMGGSGSGKSTFLRHLIGLERPTAGRVSLLDCDMTTATPAERRNLARRMGVAFQGGALLSSLSVAENVKLPLREHASLDEATMDIIARMKLEVVELGGFADLMPAELSGGMLKRAAVARAIALDPKLLFFDEPSAGLDPSVSAALDELILKLRDAMQMSIVVVTHELDSAFRIADRIAVLDRGCLLACDTPEAIRASDQERIQNLLNRRIEVAEIDPAAYLARLTGQGAPEGPKVPC